VPRSPPPPPFFLSTSSLPPPPPPLFAGRVQDNMRITGNLPPFFPLPESSPPFPLSSRSPYAIRSLTPHRHNNAVQPDLLSPFFFPPPENSSPPLPFFPHLLGQTRRFLKMIGIWVVMVDIICYIAFITPFTPLFSLFRLSPPSPFFFLREWK